MRSAEQFGLSEEVGETSFQFNRFFWFLWFHSVIGIAERFWEKIELGNFLADGVIHCIQFEIKKENK